MPPGTPEGQVVLVVEDDEPTRELYRDALTHAGFRVVAVGDGIDALRSLEFEVPGALVLDLMLPRLGGHDVYAELRAHPRTRNVPVVFVTAADVRELEASAQQFFLRKPILPETLIDAVTDAMRGQRTVS